MPEILWINYLSILGFWTAINTSLPRQLERSTGSSVQDSCPTPPTKNKQKGHQKRYHLESLSWRFNWEFLSSIAFSQLFFYKRDAKKCFQTPNSKPLVSTTILIQNSSKLNLPAVSLCRKMDLKISRSFWDSILPPWGRCDSLVGFFVPKEVRWKWMAYFPSPFKHPVCFGGEETIIVG